jgi:hypothetical protein
VAAAVFRPDNRAVVTYLPAAGTNAAAEDAGAVAAVDEVVA